MRADCEEVAQKTYATTQKHTRRESEREVNALIQYPMLLEGGAAGEEQLLNDAPSPRF